MQDLRHEIADVEAEHRAFAHRDVPPRGGMQPAVMEETDLPHGKQPAPKVRVFSVELDRRVEAADRGQRLAPHGEVAAVEDRPDAQQMLDEELRGGGQRDVVCANQHPPPPVPVVIAIGSGQRDQPGVALESPFDPLDPRQRLGGNQVG